ncbi:unnamed protein product, partial [Brenthis ino]
MSNTEEFVNTQPRIKTRKSTKSDMLPMTITLAPIDLTSNNLPLAWKKWLTKLKVYLRANNLEDETDSRKVAILLNFIGSEALEIYYSFGLDLDDLSFDDLCNKFDNYFTPKINITVERHKLFSRKQAPNESIDTYVTDIKNISHSCEFGALREDLLKDIFSWNCNNPYYKERILIEKPKTLDEAINIAKRCEATKQQTKALEDASLHFIGRVSRSPSRREAAIPRSTTRYQRSASNTSNSRNTCDRCGQVHRYKCPAKEACRRVPFQLQQPLKQELEAMEQSGVIQRVEEPTEWHFDIKKQSTAIECHISEKMLRNIRQAAFCEDYHQPGILFISYPQETSEVVLLNSTLDGPEADVHRRRCAACQLSSDPNVPSMNSFDIFIVDYFKLHSKL